MTDKDVCPLCKQGYVNEKIVKTDSRKSKSATLHFKLRNDFTMCKTLEDVYNAKNKIHVFIHSP